MKRQTKTTPINNRIKKLKAHIRVIEAQNVSLRIHNQEIMKRLRAKTEPVKLSKLAEAHMALEEAAIMFQEVAERAENCSEILLKRAKGEYA